MFVRRLRFALAVPLFCSLVTLGTPALAERHTYRDTTEVQVLTERDKPLGEYLASLVSLRRALEQAMPMIREQDFVKEVRLDEEQLKRLSYLLVSAKLNYLSGANARDPLRITYKTKLDYETLDFPRGMIEFYVAPSSSWIKTKYERQHAEKTEAALVDYLQAINASQDVSYQQLLRSSQGEKLLKVYQADQFYQQFLESMKRKQHTEAMDALEKAIQGDPDYPFYNLEKAAHYVFDHKDYESALTIYADLIAKHPDQSDLYTQRAVTYFLQNLAMDKALEDLTKAIALNPKSVMAYFYTSMVAGEIHNKALQKSAMLKACELGTGLSAKECDSVNRK